MDKKDKKIRFSLEMKDGVEVRTLEELQDNFSLEKVLFYISNGKMQIWLRDRYHNDIADRIDAIDNNDPNYNKKLFDILDVEYITMRDEKIVDNIDELKKYFSMKKALIYIKNGQMQKWLHNHGYNDLAKQIEQLDSTMEERQKAYIEFELEQCRVKPGEDRELEVAIEEDYQKLIKKWSYEQEILNIFNVLDPRFWINGGTIESLKELQNNFSVQEVLYRALEGKLQTWLYAIHLDNIAKEIYSIDFNNPSCYRQLFDIFRVEYNYPDICNFEKKHRDFLKPYEWNCPECEAVNIGTSYGNNYCLVSADICRKCGYKKSATIVI